MNHPYKDLLDLPHHVSKKHPLMAIEARAAQFAPFAALGKETTEAQEKAPQELNEC